MPSSTFEVYERASDQAQIDTAVSARDDIRESGNPPLSVLEPWVFLVASMKETNTDGPCGPGHAADSCCYFEGVCLDK